MCFHINKKINVTKCFSCVTMDLLLTSPKSSLLQNTSHWKDSGMLGKRRRIIAGSIELKCVLVSQTLELVKGYYFHFVQSTDLWAFKSGRAKDGPLDKDRCSDSQYSFPGRYDICTFC